MKGAPTSVKASIGPPASRQVSPVERYGWLRIRDGVLGGEGADRVKLTGVSLFWSQWGERFFNREVVRWLREDWGVNLIRAPVGVHAEGALDNPHREIDRALRVVDACLGEGLYVILDWHAHEPHTALAKTIFSEVVAQYGARANLIYELWNEPLPGHGWATHIKPHHEALIDLIRTAGGRGLIIAGTEHWSQGVDVAAADPLSDDNTAYALHFYSGSHGWRLRARARRALEAGITLFASEWGLSEASGDGRLNVAEARRWWRFLDNHGIGEACWSIMDRNESSAALLPGVISCGGWSEDALTPAGQILRRRIRGAGNWA